MGRPLAARNRMAPAPAQDGECVPQTESLGAALPPHAVDGMQAGDIDQRHIARVATPLAKFWNCKRAPSFVGEALEGHGGNGFIEEHPMARLYRENVADAFMAEVGRGRGADGASTAGSIGWAARSGGRATTTAMRGTCAI